MSEEARKALEEWWQIASELNSLSKMKPLKQGEPVPCYTKEEVDKMLQLCEDEKIALQKYRKLIGS